MPDSKEKVKFKRGPSETIPQDKDPGSFLVEVDTGQAYIDDSSEVRVPLRDTSKVDLPSESTDDGSVPVSDKGNVTWTKPLATPDRAGFVQPVSKSEDMTQDVGVDESGKLYTSPCMWEDFE